MKQTVAIVVVLAVLAGGGYLVHSSRQSAARAALSAQVDTAIVERTSLSQSVSSTGRVTSNLDVEIKCKASGRIIALPFDVSDVVRAGDLLVELDPVDELRAVTQAEVVLSLSQARLAQAKQNLLIAEQNLQTARQRAEANVLSGEARALELRTRAERRQELLRQNLASQEDVDSARTAALVAEAELKTVQAALEELKAQELALETRRQDVHLAEAQVRLDEITLANARQRLTDTKVVAPMDGVVSERQVQVGAIISSGITNVGGGTTVMVLSDLSRIFIEASVDESDIGQVRLNQDVIIDVDAHPGEKFTGRVVRIGTRGVTVSNVVTFRVKIEVVSGNKSLLKPEMTANVEIISDRREDVLAVPLRALSREQDRHLVSVRLPGGKFEARPVEVGLSDGSRVEVLAGLSGGETVVLRDATESRWRANVGVGDVIMGAAGGGRR